VTIKESIYLDNVVIRSFVQNENKKRFDVIGEICKEQETVINQKESCHLGQDSFTRTLYENEKIYFRFYYMVKVPPVFP